MNWCDDSPAWTNHCHAVSILFPAWERAFAQVARHYQSKVSPELAERIDSFAREEEAHANAHAAYNQRWNLEEQEDREFAKTRMVHRRPGMKVWLGTMVSIEHLAACMGRMYLAHHADNEGRDSKLFEWHAKEELGHKALAIDVWNEVGYTGLDEIVRQNQQYVCGFILRYVLSRTNWWSPKAVWDVAKWLWTMTVYVLIPMKAIYEPAFHPNNIDDRVMA
jgi:predicted metal-dependent hydrolase